MTRAATLHSIDCSSCGAGLNILGGGRVLSHVCSYCGAELDALDGYKVLRRATSTRRPDTPFALGMEGKVNGVPHVIIGLMGLSEFHKGRSWSWVEHLLFSPTHGYRWLIWEEGHTLLSRRIRTETWLSVDQVEAAESRPILWNNGERFAYFETSGPTIDHVEGEFTWRPFRGDRSATVVAVNDTRALEFTETAGEREVHLTEWVPRAEVLRAFGAPEPAKPPGTHVLAPFIPGPNDSFFTRVALGGAALCTVLALAVSGRPVQILPPTQIDPGSFPAEITLPVTAAHSLVRVEFTGSMPLGWAFVEMELNDPQDQPVLVAGREISYYTGSDADGYWTESDLTADITFRAGEAGEYQIDLDIAEMGVEETPVTNMERPSLRVRAWEGLGTTYWLWLATLAFGGVAAWFGLRPMLHQALRMRGSDWTEES